jgi:hypothetical protein
MADAQDFAIKSGATFSLSGTAAQPGGAAWNLTGATLTAKLRDAGGAEIASLTCAIVSPTGGTFTVSASDTTAWPVGTLRGDIRIAFAGGTVAFTETFTVRVERPVTR